MNTVDSVCKRVILLIVLGAALLGSLTARAASYQDALDDYSEQKYSRSYKKAMSLPREKRGTRRGKALMLAAAAVLEMDREQKARALFKKALDEDPDLDLPDVVRSRRAQRFFADVREGRGPQRLATTRLRSTGNLSALWA
jgi:predicted negative regulator of RcsB-dependent stress response